MNVAGGTCAVLLFGARLVVAGSLPSGALLVFVLYLGKMYKPMRDLSKMTDTLSKAAVAFERIGELMEIESQVRDLPGARTAGRFRGHPELAHVTFGYRPDQLEALCDSVPGQRTCDGLPRHPLIAQNGGRPARVFHAAAGLITAAPVPEPPPE